MTEGRSLLLLSCSHHKESGGIFGRQHGRSFVEAISPTTRNRILEQRNEIRRMLRGGPPRLYNEDQKGGYRDERLPNRQLAIGRDFVGSETAAYLPANKRYVGRFFGRLASMAPNFWKDIPASIEVVFVSGLYGLILWDEPIQDYDCHFADYIDAIRRLKIKDFWGSTLSDALIEFLRIRSNAAPIRTVYDLLSESLYQSLFAWEKIQGAAVYHRIFKGVSGPDTLAALARILASGTSGFGAGTYKQEWRQLIGGEEPLDFGFESKLGHDPMATREGDVETIRNRLFKEQTWLNRLSEPLCEALVLAELSWRKVEDLPKYEWGGVVVSFIKPVERFLKDCFYFVGKETFGDVAARVRTDPGWQPIYLPIERANGLFIRAKHLERPAIIRSDVPIARSLAFEILRFAAQRNR
jgi:hypothetical protein